MNGNDTHEELLAKWLNGEITEAELKELAGMEDLEELDRIMEEAGELELPKVNEAESWAKFVANVGIEGPKRIPFFRRYGLAIAAAVAIIFAATFLLIPGEAETRVVAEAGQQESLELPDGSKVRLNAGSNISYLASQWPKNRELTLEGEAFFEVKKGSRFEVKTKEGNIRVLGTSFNVRQRGKRLEVQCNTGKVSVSNAKGDSLVVLTQGEAVLVENGKAGELTFFNFLALPDWTQGSFRFYDRPFREAVEEFERQHGLEVDFPEAYKERRYNGGFTLESPKIGLKMLGAPLNLQFEKTGPESYRLYSP